MAPRVSMVMTFFNSEAFIQQAIQSVLNQAATDWQLILIDDGSTDNSAQIAESYAEQDRRIVFIRNSHKGRVPALARGLALAHGDYIGWVDSDDELHPEALAETVRYLDAHPTVGLVFTNYVEINQAGHILGLGRRCRWPYSPHALLQRFASFHFRLFRASVLDQIAPPKDWTPYAEDYDFCLRASEVTLFDKLPKPLYRYRKHRQQLSATHRMQQIQAAKVAIQQALERRNLADRLAVELELRGVYHLRSKP